ncbi:MAG TPA: glycine--tRNA ligase [Candidatus Saccharimonadales bacterium]|nr:glycine--tRNA ligase [Candidatus Saccharimonadales bacterium]
MSDITLEDIASLAKRRGFIYQGSEIYGGLAGTWDYGPLGVALKRNIMNLWWKMFVDQRDDMYGVDAAILMNQKVWKASGHVGTFTDPMVEDTKTHQRYRADHLLKDQGFNVDGLKLDDLKRLIAENNIKSPEGNDLSNPQMFNMMFKNVVGPKYTSVDRKQSGGLKAHVEFLNGENESEVVFDLNDEFSELGGFMFYDTQSISYLRPETAQGIFTNFKNVVDSFYPDIPFGLAQQGKAFRNEISPRDFVFRSREFEQMEIEYFVHPEKWEEAFEMWRTKVHEWCAALGLPDANVHELEVSEEDRAHYSNRTIDFEFDFPHGRDELLGLAYRTDFDLMNIQNYSGRSMAYRPKDGSDPFVPHVIEPSFGVERAVMATLTAAYAEDEQNGEKRIFLKLPKDLAPIKACVSPLLKNKPELVTKAREVYAMLKKELGAVMWDDNGNIGKRYRRQDEIGTPACVTIDFQTLEDNTVTVRDRDSAEQTRVAVASLLEAL